MATVIEPSPSLNGTVFDNLRTIPLRIGSPTLEGWRAITANLPESQAPLLPLSFAKVLPLLTGDIERLRLAVDIAVAFDFFEVAGSAVAVARRTGDAFVALASAALCSNPGVPQDIVDSASELSEAISLSEAQTRAFSIRLSPTFAATQDLDVALKKTIWPGDDDGQLGRRTSVALDELGEPASTYWTFAGDLYELGFSLRRIPRQVSRPTAPAWLGPNVVIVTWSDNIVSQLQTLELPFSSQLLLRADRLENAITTQRLIDDVVRISGRSAEELPSSWLRARVMLDEPLDPSVFHRGSFDSVEMAFLGGGSRRKLYGLAKDVLIPRKMKTGERIWSFDQLVAYRIWHYFQPTAPSRSARHLLRSLHQKARSAQSHVVGVTSNGVVLVQRGDDYVDAETGQAVFEDVVRIDKVFKPFELGGGRVPDLLTPSRHTTVHPARLGGTPALSKHRIPARGVARLEERRGWEAVREAYPDIKQSLLKDASEVGRELLAKR